MERLILFQNNLKFKYKKNTFLLIRRDQEQKKAAN